VKKLGLGGGAAFQWPLPKNPKCFFIKMHFFPLVLLLAFFSLMFTKVGCYVCFVL
jgi:hypothetical protein